MQNGKFGKWRLVYSRSWAQHLPFLLQYAHFQGPQTRSGIHHPCLQGQLYVVATAQACEKGTPRLWPTAIGSTNRRSRIPGRPLAPLATKPFHDCLVWYGGAKSRMSAGHLHLGPRADVPPPTIHRYRSPLDPQPPRNPADSNTVQRRRYVCLMLIILPGIQHASPHPQVIRAD
jgi:hypothetical protein